MSESAGFSLFAEFPILNSPVSKFQKLVSSAATALLSIFPNFAQIAARSLTAILSAVNVTAWILSAVTQSSASLLFVIIFCGYGVYRGYKTADTITIQLTAEEQISSIQNQVNEMSRQRQLNYLAYLNSAEAVYEKKEYIANSQLMQLDANNVYQSNILYNTAQFDGMSDGDLFSCDLVFSDDVVKKMVKLDYNKLDEEEIRNNIEFIYEPLDAQNEQKLFAFFK